MAELSRMLWDPTVGRFVAEDSDEGRRVTAEVQRIMAGLFEVREVREKAKAEWFEAVQTINALVIEGMRYRLKIITLAAAAGTSRQAVYNQLPSIEQEERELAEGTG
jgi:hypothetical protein